MQKCTQKCKSTPNPRRHIIPWSFLWVLFVRPFPSKCNAAKVVSNSNDLSMRHFVLQLHTYIIIMVWAHSIDSNRFYSGILKFYSFCSMECPTRYYMNIIQSWVKFGLETRKIKKMYNDNFWKIGNSNSFRCWRHLPNGPGGGAGSIRKMNENMWKWLHFK